jgi:predicted PurR-regulated permease PerM
MLGRIFGTLEATFSGLVLMLAFAGLAMAEVREVRERLPRRLGARGERLVQVASRIAEELRTYAGVKTITSVIAGVATTALSFAFGIDHPFVWGFLAFLLEYVPGVGSMLAILPPTLMALVQFGPTGRALGAFLAIGGMQVVLGNFIDPKIEGSRLDISPFVVLLSIVFWAWVWGPPGALLGVPATLCVIIACRQSPRLRWVAVLLATDESHRDSPDEPSDDEGEDRRDR